MLFWAFSGCKILVRFCVIFLELTMQFKLQDQWVKLKGIRVERGVLLDSKQMNQSLKKKRRGLLMNLTLLAAAGNEKQPQFEHQNSGSN